jgi:type VI secretion system protein ImpK
MTLFSHFNPLIKYVGEQKQAGFVNADFNVFNTKIVDTIESIINGAASLDKDKFDLAAFAVYCWIDETVQRSAWADKSQWQQQLLQERYFSTSNGGELFFSKLADLTEQSAEVVRVYYRCLVLGFRGKYYRHEDGAELYKLKEHCLTQLQLTIASDDTVAKMFPSVYSALEAQPLVLSKNATQQWYQRTYWKWVAPLMLLAFVFLFFFGILYFTIHIYLNLLT